MKEAARSGVSRAGNTLSTMIAEVFKKDECVLPEGESSYSDLCKEAQ